MGRLNRRRLERLEGRTSKTSYGRGSTARDLEEYFDVLEGGKTVERDDDPELVEYFACLDLQEQKIRQLTEGDS